MIEKYSCNVQLCRYETRQIVYNSHVIYTISDPMKWKKIETVVHSNGISSMLFMPKCFALLKECALTIRKTWYKLYKYDGQWNHVCTKVTMQSSMFFFGRICRIFCSPRVKCKTTSNTSTFYWRICCAVPSAKIQHKETSIGRFAQWFLICLHFLKCWVFFHVLLSAPNSFMVCTLYVYAFVCVYVAVDGQHVYVMYNGLMLLKWTKEWKIALIFN